ncbi:efflux RND transporter periplasmic adaptor subunit [Thermogemmatispora sp.]|uniref:efflux RND transporter periplasmic adaptor subunit n=1 Tax=Thermogemmatispora sp. TaxID=1968838 RepID=UPI001DF411EB|nr:efflux RND transporter periplasmic adaptor subunit [Thermogemmatispora sp.]MBX5449907.1 efflux RND transporter periplasmic adaptor subunit [Thermogemmatispora sp.]
MAQQPAKPKRRQFKPGFGMPSSQVRFYFDEEEAPAALPCLPEAVNTVGEEQDAGTNTNTGGQPQQAFIPQSLPPVRSGKLEEPPVWQVETLRLRILPGRWKHTQHRRRFLMALSCSSLLVLLVLGWLALLRSSAPAVILYQAQQQDYDQSLAGEGLVYPQRQLVLSLPFSGKVDALLVKVGDFIKAGQALLRLDPVELSLQLKQAKDEMMAAENYLQEMMISGNLSAVAQARQRYALAKSKYETLQARSSSLLSENCLLTPLSGAVTAINVVAGQLFAANAPLLTISDQSKVIVHARLPLKALGLLHPGQSAEIFVASEEGPVLRGTVLTIVPRVDPQTDTFEVWVGLDNRRGILLPGMSVFVRIAVQGKALELPRLAVLDLDLAPAVFIVQQHKAYLRPVHVIARSSDRIFIDSGLNRGNLVVLVGLANLHNGQEVRVIGLEDE